MRVRGDPDMLRQVFLNLLRNGAEALGPGGGTEVGLERSEDTVDVTVADNGSGIPTELQERVFEPLFTTRSEGTGLGLTIVKRIVEAHGGTVQVQSEPGAGTRIRVRLPAV
jgi:signal transduction histidine kinase